MKQDLIRRFLDVFEETYEPWGRADLPAMCFDWMEHTYNGCDKCDKWDKELKYCKWDLEAGKCGLWASFYDSEREFIKATVEKYNNLHIGSYLDAMVKDIGSNLFEIQSPEGKETYLINLLIPLKNFISKYCRYEEYIVSSLKSHQAGTIVYCLYFLHYNVECFARCLDVELIKQGIDLFELQEKYGIYLIKERDLAYIIGYFGGAECAEKFLSALPKRQGVQPQPEQPTLEERIAPYCEIAIRAGFMEKTNSGYRWNYGGNSGKVRLAYFITKIYGVSERIPYKKLESLFDVTRLDTSVHQLASIKTKKPQVWRDAIDGLFVK